jgi:hypothetical protein
LNHCFLRLNLRITRFETTAQKVFHVRKDGREIVSLNKDNPFVAMRQHLFCQNFTKAPVIKTKRATPRVGMARFFVEPLVDLS